MRLEKQKTVAAKYDLKITNTKTKKDTHHG